jgi:hypothetical protein
VSVVVLAPPTFQDTYLLEVKAGVVCEAWWNWVDGAGVTVDMSAYHAVLSFSLGGVGETVPAAISDVTSPATVGQIVLAGTSPNMKVTIPAAVTSGLAFRRLRATLDVTDLSLVPRRWLEATVTLDRGTGF